jgi:uncharacterized protein YbbC (DUF1343 family)
MLVGLERLAKTPSLAKNWGRCGLVCNQASVTIGYVAAWRILKEILGPRLTALFGPQHGIESTVQENMIETGHATHRPTGLPVYSLYSETREPLPDMLKNVDTLVVDLPITGCRIYTYKYTMAACLRAAKKSGKKVVVLDRPNPLGGTLVEGNALEMDATSFVGEFPMPMRHALTMAEAALYFNAEIGADLEIVALEGWNANSLWTDNERSWVITSPNMPIIESCYVFPGMVLFEGTNISEGRGTCLPFLFIGAPFVKSSDQLIATIRKYDPKLPGVHLREACFQPTNSKWPGQECQGLQIHVTDPHKIQSYYLGLAMIRAFIEIGGNEFQWRKPPYEYNYDLLPIEILIGKRKIADAFSAPKFSIEDAIWRSGQKDYIAAVQKYLLYDRNISPV